MEESQTGSNNRRKDDGVLRRLEFKIDSIQESLDGNIGRDIKGVRPRLAIVESATAELLQAVKGDKIPPRLEMLEIYMTEQRKREERLKAWVAGLAVGLGFTSLASLGTLALQAIRFFAGVP